MIEIICDPTQDSAEATTPRNALVAARTLMREAVDRQGVRPTCTFYVDGEPVDSLNGVGRQAVWFALRLAP